MPAILDVIRSQSMRRQRRTSRSRFRLGTGYTVASVMVALLMNHSRVAAQTAQAPAQSTTAQTSNGSGQAIPPVTTTVVVHGDIKDNYLPETVTGGTLDGASLTETPLSATVVTRDLLNDQVARVLSDVVKNDASIGEDYAPVGYYGDFEIRGFPIDLATGLEINGMTIAGEQDVQFENKERVELLKGVAGVESGVASAGGLIDFVTKRPATIEAIDLATDHRGSSFGEVDLGRFFGRQKQVGARLNLGAENIHSYVHGADGWRGMSAGAADWKISPNAILKTDFEYQHKLERSVCGYQLLGGTTVPDLHEVSPSTMLGEQPWEKPNTFDTYNTGARFDYDLAHGWHTSGAASFSHSLIDDNVVYAYGCGYEADCYSSGGTSPDYFFAPAGGYDVYDYRDPGELRIDAEARALVMGHLRTGPVTHDLSAGGELFRRSVQQPGYFTAGNPASPDGVVQDGAVYNYIGSENIYQPITLFPGSTNSDGVRLQAGPQRLWEDNHQRSAILQDRMHLPGRIQLLAAGRYDSLRDHNFSLVATTPCTASSGPGPASSPCPAGSVPTPPTFTDKGIWLPQFAVIYNPIDSLTLYGNYGVLLSLGPQAPWWAGSFFLPPYFTRQSEVGAKYEPARRILLSTALFHMRAPFFYPKGNDAGDDLTFVSEGHETHDGIELNAEGEATNWLRLDASAAMIRAISGDTGTPAFDQKQVINVPRFRTAVFADLSVPRAHGLHLMPGWSLSARKFATRDDTVNVSGYNLFNLGARYTVGGEQGRMTLRLYCDNITDKRYWKDTGASYGDTFIHLGAPTTVRLSAHYTF
jgi:iron complex outermembrane receptor protein